jgi:hypothetical protein
MRSPQEIAEKWLRVTMGRVVDYENGVKNPKKSWEKETASAAARFSAAATDPSTITHYNTGIRKAGDAKWQANTIQKGIKNWETSIGTNEGNYAESITKYVDVISTLKLPEKYTPGDPRNLARMKAICEALRAAKDA